MDVKHVGTWCALALSVLAGGIWCGRLETAVSTNTTTVERHEEALAFLKEQQTRNAVAVEYMRMQQVANTTALAELPGRIARLETLIEELIKRLDRETRLEAPRP